MFNILTKTLEGVTQAAINTVKLPIGVILSPLDDGKTIVDSVDGIKEGVSKIGKEEK